MTAATSYTIWQLIDSAFPTGGFAHSSGIEAMVQVGCITASGGLSEALDDIIAQWSTQSGPLTAAAFDYPEQLLELDRWCDALLAGNAVAAKASTAQGTALLMAARNVDPALADLQTAFRQANTPGHLAIVFGAVCKHLKIDRHTCLEMAGFSVVRSALSAAIRLNIIGPLAAQRVQQACQPQLQQAITTASTLPWQECASSRPLVELRHAHHNRLYSRLFQS